MDVSDCPIDVIDNSTQYFQKAVTSYSYFASFNTPHLVEYIISAFPIDDPVCNVLYVMGCAGSGKSYLADKLVAQFSKLLPMCHPFCLATDDYCIGTRSDRREIIKKTNNALLEKDFSLMKTHIQKLRVLKSGETLEIPQKYDPQTGLALSGKSKRIIKGPVGVLVIDGNFYVEAAESLMIFIHVPDPTRYTMRRIRDTKEGQKRAQNAEEVLTLFSERQETQDKMYTLPYMAKADILIESKPNIVGNEIHGTEYVVWKKTALTLPPSKNAGRKDPAGLFLQS